MRKFTLCAIIAACAALTACNGIMDGIYDPAPSDIEFGEGFTMVDNHGRMTLYINATDYKQWHYLSLGDRSIVSMDIPTALTGEWDGKSGWTYNLVEGSNYTPLAFVETDAQPEPEVWDLAIHHFDVRTNGGAVVETNCQSLSQLPANTGQWASADWKYDVWSTTDAITDLSGMLAFKIGYQNININRLMSQWATMDFSTPPPVYSSSGKVYLLRLADGEMAALQLTSYMSKAGSKGYLTIEIQYPY